MKGSMLQIITKLWPDEESQPALLAGDRASEGHLTCTSSTSQLFGDSLHIEVWNRTLRANRLFCHVPPSADTGRHLSFFLLAPPLPPVIGLSVCG
eukprot:3933430-Rhodomonas_salina.1